MQVPEIAIGLVGHVDHGKTTLVKALSGKWTASYAEELKRGITIRLGYAEFSIFKCSKCKELEAYSTQAICPNCKGKTKFLRKISIVDAPGHESLMATMLSGAAVIDYALLVIAANEHCPQPQTLEHLKALEIIGIKNIIIVQNKIDLVSDEQAKENYLAIKKLIETTPYKDAPIVPVAALHNINIDALLEAIEENFPTPERDANAESLMFIIRSFDINKPGTKIKDFKGAVIGGVLKQGTLKIGDEIEISPGYEKIDKAKSWQSLKTKVLNLTIENKNVKEVGPSCTFGLLTDLDPSIAKSDRLANNVATLVGKALKTYREIIFSPKLLERVVGARDKLIVEPIRIGEVLLLNIGSIATAGIVKEISKDKVKCELKRPIVAQPGWRLTISRAIGQRWRLIGWAEIE